MTHFVRIALKGMYIFYIFYKLLAQTLHIRLYEKKQEKIHANFALLSDAIIREMLSFSKLGHGSYTKPQHTF